MTPARRSRLAQEVRIIFGTVPATGDALAYVEQRWETRFGPIDAGQSWREGPQTVNAVLGGMLIRLDQCLFGLWAPHMATDDGREAASAYIDELFVVFDEAAQRFQRNHGSDVHDYSFEGQAVRTIERDGDVWFVAKDVCQALGLANHRDAVSALDGDEKDGVGISDAIGRSQETTVVSEPGLYKLIARSSKPAAKRFDRWVRHEVLPAIRRTGSYQAPTPAAAEASTALVPAPRAPLARVTAASMREERLAKKAAGLALARVAEGIRRGATRQELRVWTELAELHTGRSFAHLLPAA